MNEDVLKPLAKNGKRYGEEYQEHVRRLRQLFESTIRSGKDIQAEDQLDKCIEKVFKSKQNIEQVLVILQDFVNFDTDIESLRMKLEAFKNSDKAQLGHNGDKGKADGDDFDLLMVYRKIKIMLFLKNKM